jgi:spermidine synthase
VANGSLHQDALALRRSDAVSETTAGTREGYHLPYRLLKAPPRRALVVGAGTGNDVAVLLDEGAERVDAVEIDPVILDLGRQRHPDRPYADPRVRAINTDARSFLNDTRERYDLIVFGTLDSMTRLSALSNVRLDNFVYTLDCIQRARERLTPDGGIALYFMAATDYIDMRLRGMVAEAFGEDPLVEPHHYQLFNRIYMAGPAFRPPPTPRAWPG